MQGCAAGAARATGGRVCGGGSDDGGRDAGSELEVFINPFEEPTAVIEYLSRYVQSVAIANYRITDIVQGQVSFTYHDNRAGGEVKELTLSAVEFIRRFLLHVLPDQFVRIRYYGLHHSAARKTKLARARALLGLPSQPPVVPKSGAACLAGNRRRASSCTAVGGVAPSAVWCIGARWSI